MLTIRRSCGAFVVLLVLFLPSSVSHIIRTRLGVLEGVKKEARNGKIFHAYYGIPYAQPPVGRLRFEPPLEIVKPWSGTFNATEIPPRCPQYSDKSNPPFLGQEDCLFVNVHTPSDARPGTNFPVLFYIFGGAFDHGCVNEIGPEYIMGRNIVFVLVSYRLGTLGFLSTGDDVISGNMALRDQAMAMKWTKENIYDFGGDPQRVTIQGYSSGSICVHAHTMSPLSRDYFDQAIMHSGLVTAPTSFWDRDYALAQALDLGRLVNCPVESTKILKICLQSRSAKELVLAAQETYVGKMISDMIRTLRENPPAQIIWNKIQPLRFRPVIEDDRVMNAFLNESHFLGPHSTTNSKPWLLGMTADETASTVGKFIHPDSSLMNVDPKLLFPILGSFHWSSKLNQVDFIVRWLKTRFFGAEEVRNTTDIADVALVKMLTGLLYGRELIDVIQKYEGPEYVYLMDYRYAGGYTTSKGGLGGRFLGVAHGDELPIIFKMSVVGIADEDFAFGEELITRLVNFVYSGNPDRPFAINTSVFGSWAAVSSPRIEFLRIARHGSMERDYFLKEYAIWRRIPNFSKYSAE